MNKIIMLISAIIFINSICPAGDTGKLQGVISDKETLEPLMGVNIIIVGSTFGAATDNAGFFLINRIPPGKYSVKLSMIGYQSVTINDIRIMADLTTELNYELSGESIQMESIVVMAKKPVVQKDQTATRVVIEGKTISEDLRAQNINEVIKLQAGVTVGTDGAFHVRGGRTGGILYQVDGISMMNPFTRSVAGEVEVENVQELQAHIGTFDAEYGNAGDAVISISTKDGGEKMTGKFSYESPMLNSSPYHEKDWSLNREEVTGLPQEQKDLYLDQVRKPDGSSAYDFMSVLDDPAASDYLIIPALGTWGLNLSGPIPFINKLKYFISGRLRNEDSYLPFGYTLYRNVGVKLSYPINDALSIRGSYDWSQNFSQSYDHQYKYWRWFNTGLDTLGRKGSYPMNKELSNRQSIRLRHVVSNNSFYDLTVGRVYDYSSTIVPDRLVQYDPNTGELISSEYLTRLYVGGTEGNFMYGDVRYWIMTHSTQYILKGTYENQLTKNHQLRTGFDTKSHEIFRHRIGMLPRGNLEYFNYKPIEIAGFIQDKIEYSFMILKLGLRVDYFDPKASAYTDPSDILYTLTDTEGNSAIFAAKKDPVEPHLQISPRIGIAHPISDKTSIHFAYGHFFQIPRFYDLYRNDDLDNILVNDALVGNPALKPEKTVSYEVGLQQELSDEWGLNVTVYSKDISNLISSYYYFSARDYTIFTNADFGRVQGMDLTLDKRFADNYSLRLSYSLMYALGNESDPTEGFNSYREDQAHLRPNRNFPLDFDQRHKIDAVLIGKTNDRFGPETFGFYPLENLSMAAVFSAGSGLPYTPSSRATEESNIVPEPNSARRPWTVNLDLRISRKIKISPVDVTFYVDVENVFDEINTRLIWSRTGEAWNEGPTSTRSKDRQANPSNAGPRRSIKAGFYFDF